MTKDDYLKALRANIKNVPADEVTNIIQYYSEYFDEAGAENTAKVIEELGPPKQLATRVCADYAIREVEQGTGTNNIKKKASNTWLIVLAVIGSPVWFPLAIAVAAVLIALVVAAIMVLVAFGITAAAAILTGVVMIGSGFVAAFSSLPTMAVFVGGGFMIIGVGILSIIAILGIIKLLELIFVGIAKLCIRKGTK